MDDSVGDIFGMPNGSILNTHDESKCAGSPCCIHHPSDHPLKNAPLLWRSDRYLMERVCEHGIGHPDPDHLAFVQKIAPELAEGQGVHGCDHCCQEPLPDDRTRIEQLMGMLDDWVMTAYLGDKGHSPWPDDPDGGDLRIARALKEVLERAYDAHEAGEGAVGVAALLEEVESQFHREAPPTPDICPPDDPDFDPEGS